MDFDGARRAVTRQLDRLYAGGRESPTVLSYGFDTGRAWAPMVDWDGVFGVYVYLADKRTGALRGISLPEFLDMPDPVRIGPWPKDQP